MPIISEVKKSSALSEDVRKSIAMIQKGKPGTPPEHGEMHLGSNRWVQDRGIRLFAIYGRFGSPCVDRASDLDA